MVEERLHDLDFAFAWGDVLGSADFRTVNDDFVVDEVLAWEPEGEGEHIYLQIKKSGENTQWIAKKLAHFCDVGNRDIGFSGMKDRHAVTTQWFSIYHPAPTLFDWQAFEGLFESVVVMRQTRGARKLRRGQHSCNVFNITLRNTACSKAKLEARLHQIKLSGVPNYFGEQRFGRDAGNLRQAEAYFEAQAAENDKKMKKRKPVPIVISAARSYLFNRVLSERVRLGNWQVPVAGEPDHCGGLTNAPLWGRGRNLSHDDLAILEKHALESFEHWKNGLEHCGLAQERRALVLRAEDLSWQIDDTRLRLSFALSPGAFATSVLRELFVLNNRSTISHVDQS